jgi:hypothetical protein
LDLPHLSFLEELADTWREGVVRYLFGGVELEIDPDFGFGYQK